MWRTWKWGSILLGVAACNGNSNQGVDGGGGAIDTPPPQGRTFEERCAEPEVIACFGFDSPSETTPYLNDSGHRPPVFDSALAADGAGSIRMTVAAGSGPDTSGSFVLDFPPGTGIGEGETLFVQWRQRFSRAFLEADFGPGALGWKQMLVHENTSTAGCSPSEIVATSDRGFGILYHACNVFESPRENPVDGDIYEHDLQPGGPSRCLYSWLERGLDHVEPSDDVDEVACLGYLPDQWMTFAIGVHLTRWCTDADYDACPPDSRLQLWIGEEGASASNLAIDWPFALRATTSPATTVYDSLQFTPYHTGKNPSVAHPTGELWYDSVIISRAPIGDP
ncbi:MAG: hypothetical protein ACKV2T_43160 [Kofleriaceae bacterium]